MALNPAVLAGGDSTVRENYELDVILRVIGREVKAAEAKFPEMNSAHEAFAVMQEEIDEVWEIVKQKQSVRDLDHLQKELVQVAAMAVRFIKMIQAGRGRV
jgi:hypothetical protein